MREAATFGTRPAAVALDWSAVVARQHDIVRRLRPTAEAIGRAGVRLHVGEATLADAATVRVGAAAVRGNRIVIAAGSAPIVPPIPGRELGITSDELLFLPEFPTSLVLIGAGAIGLEMGGAFSDLGSTVTVIAQEDEILAAGGFDPEVAAYLRRLLEARGVTFHLGARVTALTGRAGEIVTHFTVRGDSRRDASAASAGTVSPAGGAADAAAATGQVQSAVVCFAAGRRFDPAAVGAGALGFATSRLGLKTDAHLRTSVAGVYAAGDAAGNMQLTPTAAYEGRIAAANAIQGDNLQIDLAAVPQVIFTTPEIARVGLTERQARASDLGCHVSTHDMRGASNGVATGEDAGFLKLVFEHGTERLLGAQMVSYAAAELIQLATVAVRARMTAGMVTAQLAIHPSHAERLIKVAGHEYHNVCEI